MDDIIRYIILTPVDEDNIDKVAQDFGWEDSEDMLQDLGHYAEEIYDLYVDEIDPITKELKFTDSFKDGWVKKNISLLSIVDNRVYREKIVAFSDGEHAYIEEWEYDGKGEVCPI